MRSYDCEIDIPLLKLSLKGLLNIPQHAKGLVLFAHGSGSGRLSPRNQLVARSFQEHEIATLLVDLLSLEEEHEDQMTGQFRFDLELLANRLIAVNRWLSSQPSTQNLPVAYFGASTGAAAALLAAAHSPESVHAIVSRGGRADLAGAALQSVRAPTLLIVGSRDPDVLALNQEALTQLNNCSKQLSIIPGATHLFPEEGALQKVCALALQWLEPIFKKVQASTFTAEIAENLEHSTGV